MSSNACTLSNDWYLYEIQSVDWIKSKWPMSTVWHWKDIPEHHLYQAGYILDFGDHRTKRLDYFTNSIPDCGLDFLIKETKSDQSIVYHGGQCKHYNRHVSGNDLGYFPLKIMMLQKTNPQSTGILLTSSGICKELEYTLQSLPTSLQHYNLSFDSIKAKALLEIPSISSEKTMTRRDYQVDVLKRVISQFNHQPLSKVVLNLTCALGKTVIAGDILAQLRPKLIVAIAPLKSELENLIERLPVLLPGYQTFVLDSDYTTDIESCRRQLISWSTQKQSGILFTTFKSASTILIKELTAQSFTQDNEDQFDSLSELSEDDEEQKEEELTILATLFKQAVLLADEVHNISVNNKALHYFVNFFSRTIYCTATLPRYFKTYFSYDLIIDDYDFKYALNNHYVTDYRIMIPSLSTGQESIPIECKDLAHYDLLFYKALFLLNGMLSTGSRRVIVYLLSKEECKQFMNVVVKIGIQYHGIHIWADRINDDIRGIKRKQIFNDFESDKETGIKVLASCNCLDEAVNLTRCDSTFIASVSYKASEITMYQRFNRASRLDPLNPNKINHCFIWCDDSFLILEKVIRKLKLNIGDSLFESKVSILYRSYDDQHLDEVQQLLQQQKLKLNDLMATWVTIEQKWEIYLERVRFYVETNLRFPISTDKTNGGSWIHVQKKEFINKTLSLDRIEKLRTIPLWVTWENDPWKQRFNEYKIYSTDSTIVLPDDQIKILKEWMFTQKKNFRNQTMDVERLEILDTLREWVNWKTEISSKDKRVFHTWDHMYSKFKEYCTPDAKLPTRCPIGIWVNTQKENFKDDKLTDDQLELLNQISQWKEWQTQNQTKSKQVRVSWETQFERLQAYITQHNKIPPKRHKNTPGIWFSDQKKDYQSGTLPPTRLDRLRTLPLWREYEREHPSRSNSTT
jgi:superfamily II DNA or RNA helicase